MRSDLLENIPVTFHDRRWMKSAKAWRCIFLLPLGRGELVPVLSGMIDRQFRVEIANDELQVEIDPAQIIDVPVRGKNAQLWIETVYEGQNGVGPKITAMVGSGCTVSILPMGNRQSRGDITPEALKGLHAVFFPLPEFQTFIAERTGKVVCDEATCKDAFKTLMNVQSCKHLSDFDVRGVVRDFNAWMKGA